MCEPYHSIVQFENNKDDDDHDHPAAPPPQKIGWLSKAGSWLKKVGARWHMSQMGSGHSGTVGSLNELGNLDGVRDTFILPSRTLWEGQWWDRKIKFDSFQRSYRDITRIRRAGDIDKMGGYNAYRDFMAARALIPEPTAEDREQARQEAERYSGLVATGSLPALRQFLEVSIDKSKYPAGYFEQFREILNRKGKEQYEHGIRRIMGARPLGFLHREFVERRIVPNRDERVQKLIESVKKLCLGFTRKRELLVPEWADDLKLWTPSTSIAGGALRLA